MSAKKTTGNKWNQHKKDAIGAANDKATETQMSKLF
jgi:hypothetical protein